ncbi:MAG: TonB-dependent receptor [Bacteroidales bacterium]|nr:TonB-dependent receptor [Bacteroidales bacterium]
MRKLRLLFTCLLTVLALGTALAQNITVKGSVTDASGEGVPFASIQVKGTMTGTATDGDGNYSIDVPKKATLIFSSIGYLNQEVAVDGRSVINVILATDTENLEEAVITIAYGAAKKSTLTGAISNVNADKIETRPVSTVTSALEGTVTGVQVNSTFGNPGSDPSIMIRGNGTVNGSSSPMYVIDGVPYGGNLSDLNPADIESMTVLKDAASAALYGNRASNGVILITTKKGKSGRLNVSFSATAGVYQRGIPEYDLADAREFMNINWMALKNDRQYYYGDSASDAAAYANANLISDRLKLNIWNKSTDALFQNGELAADATILKGYQDDLDWFGQTIKPGFRQEYNATAAGATDKADYYFSLGYLDENGYLRTSGFNRLSGRAAVNVKPTSYMKLGFNVNATHQSYLNTSTSSNAYVNPFMYCRNIAPIYPVHLHDVNTGEYILDADGKKQYDPGYYYDENGIQVDTRNQYVDRHVIWENELNQDKSTRNTMNAIATIEFYFLKDFTLTFNGNLNLRSDIEQSYDSAVIGDGKGNNGRGSRNEYNYKNYTFQQQLRWAHQFGDHSVNILIGHENYSNHYDYLYGYKTSEVFPNVNNLRNFTEITSLYNYGNNYRTESYLSRVRYNYLDKYNVEASFRRDGSSRFATKARWGNFWSIGANWMISREDFMQNVGWVNTLKLRADFGQVGNDSGSGLYGYQALYTSGQNANKGAYWISQLPNYDLKWETGQSWGVGIESRLFNRWNLNVEYFDRRNKDLLFDVILPITAGPTSTGGTNPSITQNIGTMSNRGVEIETDIDIVRNRDLRINFFANATFLKSKILSLPEQNRKEGIIDGTKRYVEGGDRYAYWLYQFAGVDQMTGLSLYKFDDERFYITDDNTKDGKVIYGSAKDADGNANSLMEAHNYTIINGEPYVWNPGSYGKKDWSGTATPTVYGSFGLNLSWKGFTLSSIFTYGLGSKVYDGIYAGKMGVSASPSSVHEDNLNAWTGAPAGMTETSPDRIDPNGTPMNYTFSTYNMNGKDVSISNNAGTSNRWLVSGNYLVVKNIALSYSLPKRWLTPLQIQGLSITASGENLFTCAARKGLNPQYSFGGVTSTNTFVTARVFTAGINVKF